MKKGISLIVLVITIIVIIILAGAVILSLANNNPIAQATEASFKSTADSYNSELNMTLSAKYVQDFTFDPNMLYARPWDGVDANIANTVKQYITSMTKEDGSKYVVYQGKLEYAGIDNNEKNHAKNVGLLGTYSKSSLVLNLNGLDFKNSPQTTNWIDRSGYSRTTTPRNFSFTNISGSDGDRGVVFDGVDDYVEVNDIFNITYDTSATISVWVNPATIAKDLVLVGKNEYEYLLYQKGAGFGFIQWNPSGANAISITTSSFMTVGQWTNVTYKYDGVTKRGSLYVNGVLQTSAISAFTSLKTSSENLKIGKGYSWGGQFTQNFAGKMSNVMFYNRALSDAEILELYNATK